MEGGCLVLAELPWLFLFLSARGPLRWDLLGHICQKEQFSWRGE